jgi:ribosomal subunit interface protein
MQQPLQITFRDIPHSDAVETAIREKAEKLDQFYDQIMTCRVVVESPHTHHHQGRLYNIRIDLTVQGGELVANRAPGKHQAHEDIYVAIRDAFDAARRQLQDFKARQKKKVKSHEVPDHGRVVEILPSQDFGRIVTPDGREIYFHRNSLVRGEFDELDVGSEVRYVEEDGEQGPQASSVYLVGKHHIVG